MFLEVGYLPKELQGPMVVTSIFLREAANKVLQPSGPSNDMLSMYGPLLEY